MAYIRIITWPASRVYIDGQRVGEAPMRELIPISPGEHTILLVSASGDIEKEIRLREGELYEFAHQFDDPAGIGKE